MSFQSLRRVRQGAIELGHPKLIHLSQGDAEQLPFAGNAFDLIVSLGVLHHTADTAGSIREVYRLLKPGGRAIIMLYRSGNPKWWMTSFLRAISRFIDFLYGKPDVLLEKLRARKQEDSRTQERPSWNYLAFQY
ncbi:MAG: class I SAM-dependent methyltransferase [Anaerolineales bacterium]